MVSLGIESLSLFKERKKMGMPRLWGDSLKQEIKDSPQELGSGCRAVCFLSL